MYNPIKTIMSILLLATANSYAQPVIQDNMPPYGFSTTMHVGTNITSAGGPGANVTWDFSFQSSFTFVGILEYMDIAGTEFEADFPTCNLVARKRIGGDTTFNYYTNFGSFMEIYAENMGAMNQADYAQNKKLLFNFPMNYGDSLVDTWQRIGASGKITRTYDGWGKLRTLYNEYSTVVRIKSVDSFIVGATPYVTVSYDWYPPDALIPVAHYDDNSQQMTILKTFALDVENTASNKTSASISPNPFRESTTLHVDKVMSGMRLTITNAVGQVVRVQDITTNNTNIDRESLNSGIYFYRVQSKEGVSATGKLVIE
jgi:hypothetical protein